MIFACSTDEFVIFSKLMKNKVYVDGVDNNNDDNNESATNKGESKNKPDVPPPPMSVLMFEDDEFYKKWGGSMIIGPLSLAVYALIVIVSGEITLTTWQGSCGYSLTCMFIVISLVN